MKKFSRVGDFYELIRFDDKSLLEEGNADVDALLWLGKRFQFVSFTLMSDLEKIEVIRIEDQKTLGTTTLSKLNDQGRKKKCFLVRPRSRTNHVKERQEEGDSDIHSLAESHFSNSETSITSLHSSQSGVVSGLDDVKKGEISQCFSQAILSVQRSGLMPIGELKTIEKTCFEKGRFSEAYDSAVKQRSSFEGCVSRWEAERQRFEQLVRQKKSMSIKNQVESNALQSNEIKEKERVFRETAVKIGNAQQALNRLVIALEVIRSFEG